MRRRTRRLVAEFELSLVEAEYLHTAAGHLTNVPRRPRRAFLRETAELLSGRPTADSPSELVAALGHPSEFVQAWRVDEGFDRWMPPWKLWWYQSSVARWLQVAALVAIVIGGLIVRSYYSATPEILNMCSGARATDVESLHAAGETEYRMPLRIGERYGVYLCPYSQTPGVTIERVYMANPTQVAIQPVGWELDLDQFRATAVGDASAHRPWRPEDVPGGARVTVWFEAEYCNIGGGGSIGFDRLSVDYRYRGRSRTTEIDLLATYSVWSGEGQCGVAERAVSDAQDDAWKEAVDLNLVHSIAGPGADGVGPSGLWPVSISRDLCRYLRGVEGAREPLAARAVFQLDDEDLASTLIDGAVLGVCHEFAARRDELHALLGE